MANELKLKELNDRLDRAFRETAQDFAKAQIAEIESVKWGWNGITIRQNGEVVFTPRNIVDTGQLRDSLSLELRQNVAKYRYSVPYAAIVHEGGVTSTGNIYPARPWIDTAIESDPPLLNFVREFSF
jgi:phage gpG-like protein